MTRPRQIAFRSLVVHRPEPGAARAPAPAPAPSRFEALLRRRTAAPAASADAPAAPAPRPEPARASSDDERGQGEPSHDEPPPGEEVGDPEWAAALIPTSATLDPLLAEAVAASVDGESRRVLEAVAQTIAGFCNERSVDDSDGWNVRIELRPDILPDTTLELAISSYWLQLRFVTPEPRSRQLISQHQDALRDLLTGLLNRQRDISISIE
jgi:type III secretion control protein HpaP